MCMARSLQTESRKQDDALRVLYSRASSLIDGFSGELRGHEAIPQSLMDADFVPGARLNLDLFFKLLAKGMHPTDEEIRPLIERATALVRDGMPLDEVLANYRIGTSFVWSQLIRSASDPLRDVLLAAALPLAQYLSTMTARIAIACVQHTPDPRWEQREYRRGITDALLAGSDPFEWAHDPAIPVADAFLVAVFRLGRPSPGTMTQLRNQINEIPGSFVRLDSGGWTALVPLEPGDTRGSITFEHMDAPLALTAPTAERAPFWVGISTASTRAQVPAAAADAKVLAELGRCLAKGDVVCRRSALLFEYTVAVSAARQSLTTILDPLADQPMLSTTLDAFVESGFNQLATGRALDIHRNTVTYRLSRVHELTGLDPQRPADAITLSAARIARRLEAESFSC